MLKVSNTLKIQNINIYIYIKKNANIKKCIVYKKIFYFIY